MMAKVLASGSWRSARSSYLRSNKLALDLSLKDDGPSVRPVDRVTATVNDCVELRWAAPETSDEASTCKRHCADQQRASITDTRLGSTERACSVALVAPGAHQHRSSTQQSFTL